MRDELKQMATSLAKLPIALLDTQGVQFYMSIDNAAQHGFSDFSEQAFEVLGTLEHGLQALIAQAIHFTIGKAA